MSRMSTRLGFTAVAIVLGAGSTLSAQAQGTWDPFMKLHVQLGTKVDEGQEGAFGIGFGANTKLGVGVLGLEANFMYNPGTEKAFVPTNAFGADSSNSVQTAKHSTTQIGVRGSYGMPLVDDWGWHAGIGLAFSKDILESNGTFGYAGALPNGAWNATPSKSSVSFMPFVGITYKTSEYGSLEINAVYVSYKRAEATAVFTGSAASWAGVVPSYGDQSYSSVRIELGYAFHF